MGEQKTISKYKKLASLFQLMPQYYDDDQDIETKVAMDRIRKAIDQDTSRSSTIKTKLKEIAFDVERYPEKQIFVFYLTYLQFIHTNRPLFTKPGQQWKQKVISQQQEDDRPNQQLIPNIKKFDMDYRFREVGVQFLLCYSLYQDLESVEDSKQFVELYNKSLVLMHLQVKEYLKVKGNEESYSEEIEETIKQFQQEAHKRERLHAYRYYYEESQIDIYISHLYSYIQRFPYKDVVEFVERQLISYDKTIFLHKRDNNWDSLLYLFMFLFRYFLKACEALMIRSHLETDLQQESALKDFSIFLEKHMKELKKLTCFVREKMQTNILLGFGGRMLFLQEQNHYICQLELLKGLAKEYQAALEGQSNCPYTRNPETLDDVRLNKMTTKELLNLIIPEESKRPKSIRKHIKERVRDIIQVLEQLKIPYGIAKDVRDSNFIRSMYEELYQYNTYSYKNAKGYSGIIKHIREGTESPGELLLLKEKQIRGLFRIQSLMHQYPAYVEAQEKLLKHALQIFSSFEHKMER